MAKLTVSGFIKKFIGSRDFFTIEHLCLNASIIVSIGSLLFIVIKDLLFYKNYHTDLYAALLSLLFCLLYYFAKIKRWFLLPSIILFVIYSLGLSCIYIISDGFSGPAIVFFGIFTVFFSYLFSGYKRLILLLIILANISGLVVFELLYPKIIDQYTALIYQLTDVNLNATFILLILGVFLIYIKKELRQQQIELIDTSDKLKNQLIEKEKAQNQLTEFNENLETLLESRSQELMAELATRKQAEQKVILEHNMLKNIIEATPEAIVILDQNGLLIECNRKALELLNETSKNSLSNANLFQLVINKNHNTIAEKIKKLLSSNDLQEIEYEFTNHNGKEVVLKLSFGTVYVEPENKNYHIIVANDISSRKKTETELRIQSTKLIELNTTKDRFFSIIAHDLRDPLNAIIGFSDILISNYELLTEIEKKNYLRNIHLSSESLMRLLQNLLEWSKSQTGKMAYNPQPLNIFEITNEILEQVQFSVYNKKITLQSEIDNQTLAYGDINMIKTILRNLVTNAIKFTPQLGSITIKANQITHQQTGTNYVEISVIDTGVGIKKHHLAHLLKLDKKISTKGTDNETGSGLGLILCEELIKKNKGYFTIHSIENSGSTFTFALPQNP
ncbi:MAG: PAS domain-containing sensor histidine kinase [Bacteroidota bacterium]